MNIYGDPVGFKSSLLHAADDLIWYFAEHLLCQVASFNAFFEFDKLNDIAFCDSARLCSEQPFISIELLHHSKVSFAYADNND